MGMFVGGETRRAEDAEGNWVDVRGISRTQRLACVTQDIDLEQIQNLKLSPSLVAKAAMGGVEQDELVGEIELTAYDLPKMILAGFVAWSDDAEPTLDKITALTDELQEKAARHILNMAKSPPAGTLGSSAARSSVGSPSRNGSLPSPSTTAGAAGQTNSPKALPTA